MMEENKENKKNNKRKLITILLCVSLLCVIAILVIVIFDRNEENVTPDESHDKIKYKIVEKDNCKNGEYCIILDVNGHEVHEPNAAGVTYDSIYDLRDALLIVENFDHDVLYIIGSEGEILGVVCGELNYADFNKLENNEIYFATYVNEYYNDINELCELKDNDIVYTFEKVKYEGNGEIGPSTILEKLTKKEYLANNDMVLKCE